MEEITTHLCHNGYSIPVKVNAGTEVGFARERESELEEIGAPSSYSLAVNGVGVADSHVVKEGDRITFRPVQNDKG